MRMVNWKETFFFSSTLMALASFTMATELSRVFCEVCVCESVHFTSVYVCAREDVVVYVNLCTYIIIHVPLMIGNDSGAISCTFSLQLALVHP